MIPFIDTLPQWVQTYGTVATSSLGASVYYWWTQRAGVENPERFKPEKAGVTMGVAFALSLVLYGTGTVTGSEQLLAHLSIGVGPIALWAQKGIQQYQRTGEINITNGSVDEAAEAFADALGISAKDLFALADLATAAPVESASGNSGNGGVSKTEEKARLAETSDTDPREDPKRPEERDHPDAPDPDEVPNDESGGGPLKTMVVHLDDKVDQRIQESSYRTLQKVGGHLDSVDGSGRSEIPIDEQIRAVPPARALAAFDGVESIDSVGEDAFQLTD